jgi:hypothetical protein
MERMKRREFIRLGAGVVAAAFCIKNPLSLFPAQTQEDFEVPKAARVSYLYGELLINGVSAEQGAEIFEGDIVQTGDNSEADIEIRDYAIFHIKANSTVEMNDIFQNAGVTVKRGWFLTIVRSGKDFAVSTPMVLAGVRGTVLFMNVLDDGRLYLCNCNGKIDIMDAKGMRRLKTSVSEYHTAFSMTRTGSGTQITAAGLLYHHDSDILKMAKRFQKETEVFRKKKGGGYY